MKAMRTIRNLQFVLCGAIGLVIAGIVASALAQSAPQPVLLLQRTNTTQFWLTITNAVASTNYEIYKAPTLDGPWINQDMMVGVVGQSNFLVDRKSTRLNSSHQIISYAVFSFNKKNKTTTRHN